MTLFSNENPVEFGRLFDVRKKVLLKMFLVSFVGTSRHFLTKYIKELLEFGQEMTNYVWDIRNRTMLSEICQNMTNFVANLLFEK